ncbi:Meiotically up-regulated gene 51 protein [Neolecta irregularis DAH-3]|uniref:Meiotically up-regulated gene 51 protein n=1 Tax=Neolecta irregularis (strain DAH-3) TaxID=1198029 RepID=A0A1U7LLS0_NEOID|nr:Meiotically up-regulated gene 51 protein [Neolecta irregularis DAH-3]|eukprot:OLL23589.1 Meiotically up-regulated gene 51 protein [Neolecta irregularis DAH-3]
MPNHLSFTAAPTSRINKRPSKSSFKKGITSPVKTPPFVSRSSTQHKLDIIATNVPFETDYIIPDALTGIKYLCEKMFTPIEMDKMHRNKIAELYAAQAAIPRVILLHQLHSLCTTNHTQVDRELADICEKGYLQRIMFHGRNEGDFALMLAQDFKGILEKLKASESEISGAVENFEKVLFEKNGVFTGVRITNGQNSELTKTNISTLCSKGLLTLDHTFPGSYAISLPNIGTFLRNLRSGRREILRILKKQQFKEILEKNLLERKLKASLFSWEFHLHDIYGSGEAERFTTPVGPGIRLTS